MSIKFVAFALLVAAGTLPFASEPAVSRGGVRFAPAPRIAIPPTARQARARVHIPPSARGYATISPQRPFATITPQRPFATVSAQRPFAATPQRPFGQLVRRHHRIYHAGWSFPVTFGGDAYPGYYIGVPYDPAEAFPVYGPAPAADPVDPPPARAPIMSRAVSATPGDACRSEQVTVPAGEGEQTITVVRC